MFKKTIIGIVAIGLVAVSASGALAQQGGNGDSYTVNDSALVEIVGTGMTFTTIQAAINAAVAGDTVLVHHGTYKESVTLNKAIVVASASGPGNTIIDAADLNTRAVTFGQGFSQDTKLIGFTIRNGEGFRGGNIFCSNSSPSIIGCIVEGGRAVYGAGMYLNDSSAYVANCLLSGNLSAYGSGIFCSGTKPPAIVNCTISGNRADSDGTIDDPSGAGIFIDGGSATIINTIIWGNTCDGMPCPIDGGTPIVSYSNIEGGWAGDGNIDADPMFVMPGYWQYTPDLLDDYWTPGNYRLQGGSPSIDAGTSDNAPDIDIDGNPRYDDPDVPNTGGGAYPFYDMGAYEWYPPTLIQLSFFGAQARSRQVILNWSTAAEIDNAGFNLYRTESANGPYEQINASLIPARGWVTMGAMYEFIDTDVQNRKTYWYKLEDVDYNGSTTLHGPVQATPRLVYGVFQ